RRAAPPAALAGRSLARAAPGAAASGAAAAPRGGAGALAAVAVPLAALLGSRRRGRRARASASRGGLVVRRQEPPKDREAPTAENRPRNPLKEWRDAGYPLYDKDNKGSKAAWRLPKELKGSKEDWMFGLREALGGKEGQLLDEAKELRIRMREAELRQAEIEEKLNSAEAKESDLRAQLLEEQFKAREALATYEMLTQQVEEAQIERDLANDKAAGASDLERQLE
ncbi:unnamed protein product, partial [Prorocentrum cordatum]